jgi:hypothetical protein
MFGILFRPKRLPRELNRPFRVGLKEQHVTPVHFGVQPFSTIRLPL